MFFTSTAPAREPAREESSVKPEASRRLVSVDAYRGFVMLLMASDGLMIPSVARDLPSHHVLQILAGQLDHVQWAGCCLWDMIQPSFTFIVGVALPFSLAKRRARGERFGFMLTHAMWRSLLLIALGIFLRSIGRRQTNFTFEDTLTQIGMGYTFLFLLAWCKPRTQIIAVAAILFGYWLLFALYPLPSPDFSYSSVGVSHSWLAQHGLHGFANHWGKNSNAAAAFDVWFLNHFPRSSRFAFNGGGYLTLSFIPTLGTMILGLLVGQLMKSDRKPSRKVLALLVAGAVGLGVGMLLDKTGVCPVVKRIWTPSWTIYSAGWACLMLAGFYAVIDWIGFRGWAFPLVVVGMNSIAMYCLADGGFRSFIFSNLRTNLGAHAFRFAGAYEPVVEFSVVLTILWLVCFWMYRRKIFLRI